jgi:hypothetical protein
MWTHAANGRRIKLISSNVAAIATPTGLIKSYGVIVSIRITTAKMRDIPTTDPANPMKGARPPIILIAVFLCITSQVYDAH